MSAELTERRKQLLKLIIQEYIDTATPVASEVLVRKYGLPVSSATVRNEMAVLEELGLLTHLHTSAGRIPTDAGYRYFVENLMDRSPLSPQEQRTIRHQFYQVRSELDQWIHLAAAVLARHAQAAALVTPPRAYEARYKHLELIAIHETTVLLVLVFQDGTIKQQTLTLNESHDQEVLSRSAGRINQLCSGRRVGEIEQLLSAEGSSIEPPLSSIERLALEQIVRAMHQIEEQANEQIHHDGLLEILSQPEFSQVERVRQVLEILEHGRGLGPLIPQALASDGIQVVIGGEHGRDEMREYSVILSRYGVDGSVVGVLGVLGPRRMPYPRSISTVRYISNVMTNLLGELYGE
ncbi:MAG: heat-inducible transcription repressor HrcA [Herpetosiphonaceae bacterium]|nr:MAG: heat-inducible transcription repressor HrcA [Herpetosiphonaceae bacterium]